MQEVVLLWMLVVFFVVVAQASCQAVGAAMLYILKEQKLQQGSNASAGTVPGLRKC